MNVKAEIETLKNTVKVLSVNKQEEQVLTREIKLLKEEIQNIHLDNYKMLQKVEQLEEDLTDSEEDFKDMGTGTNTCEECNFTCTGEITMRKHVNTKHGSLLKSIVQSAEGLTNKCAVSDFDDFF
jgi:predicted RNase H-like nuclease (RuvC/YqgF family)